MNKKKLLFLSITVLLCLGAFYFYHNVLYKEARNINEEKSAFLISTTDLANDYSMDSPKADLKYLDKTIEVGGKVTEVSDSTVVLDGKVFCKMNEKVTSSFLNQQVNIKGRCIGYDDLFEIIKLDQCNTITKF